QVNRKRIIFHHDNAKPHVSLRITQKLLQLGWKVLNHPPYSPDIAPSDFVHLGEGIAVCEEQLRAVKWSDYRKLTRGLAAILFSPTELATCSVTGQRWSRAGTATERPVKPALDKAKVQAIISYVTSRFPTVDVSSVKQVLAYKCKENSTALKMKSIRYIWRLKNMAFRLGNRLPRLVSGVDGRRPLQTPGLLLSGAP
ncbi:Histone-lysine N-methyltransferase SETMAR, partial [Dufourea novaeangliae]